MYNYTRCIIIAHKMTREAMTICNKKCLYFTDIDIDPHETLKLFVEIT